MLNWKYFEKFGNISTSLNFDIYFVIFFSLSGFWVWNFEIFPGSAIFGLDLGYFQNFFTFPNQAFKT